MPWSMYVLLAVLLFIMCQQLLPISISIWQITCVGALLVLCTFAITWRQAFAAIDWNIMGYLLGVFYLGQALEDSGTINSFAKRILNKNYSAVICLWLIIFASGLLSALLLNDTVAIMLLPLIVIMAQHLKAPVWPFLLALAYAVTIGSVMSPVGNPQNLLIAVKGGMSQPMITFLSGLFIPTIINLFLCAGFFHYMWQRHWRHLTADAASPAVVKDSKKCFLSRASLLLLLVLLIAKEVLMETGSSLHIPFAAVALISAMPYFIFSPQRFKVLRRLDWGTLLFFIALFILMASVWQTGFLQHLFGKLQLPLANPGVIMIFSAALSQLVSNVPCVALYLPYLQHMGHLNSAQLLSLAAGSTMAGNFLIFGAASNIIIVQQAHRRGVKCFSLWQHAKYGVPSALVMLLVYYFI